MIELILVFIFMVLNGGGQNDLLDFIPTDSYWDLVEVSQVNFDSMSEIIAEPDDSAQRLMAIRTLGEQGDEASLEILEPLVDSQEMFVGAYARRSIAWIKGEEPQPGVAVDQALMDMDLALLNADMSMVAQLRLSAGAMVPLNWAELFAGMPQDMMRNGPEGMLEEIAEELFAFATAAGNFRLDAMTFGLSGLEDDGEIETMAYIFRGQYDRQRVLDMLTEEGDMTMYSIGDDIEVAASQKRRETLAMMMPDDERFIILVAPGRDREAAELPIDYVADMIESEETEPALDEVVLDQIDEIDREEHPAWVAWRITDWWQQDPDMGAVFGAFDTARCTFTQTDEGMVVVNIVAQGGDADEVSQAADVLKGYIDEATTELSEMVRSEPGYAVMFQPILTALRGAEVQAEGQQLTGSVTLPPGAISLILGL